MESRTTGLFLLACGVALFAGTSLEWLPAQAFLAGAACSVVGLVVFMKGQRQVTNLSERRHARALHPDISRNRATGFAEREARRMEDLGAAQIGERSRTAAQAARASRAAPVGDELVLYDVDDADDDPSGLGISSDVSFPIELQETEALADKLEKLRRLHEDGIITDEEFSIAKSKTLS